MCWTSNKPSNVLAHVRADSAAVGTARRLQVLIFPNLLPQSEDMHLNCLQVRASVSVDGGLCLWEPPQRHIRWFTNNSPSIIHIELNGEPSVFPERSSWFTFLAGNLVDQPTSHNTPRVAFKQNRGRLSKKGVCEMWPFNKLPSCPGCNPAFAQDSWGRLSFSQDPEFRKSNNRKFTVEYLRTCNQFYAVSCLSVKNNLSFSIANHLCSVSCTCTKALPTWKKVNFENREINKLKAVACDSSLAAHEHVRMDAWWDSLEVLYILVRWELADSARGMFRNSLP